MKTSQKEGKQRASKIWQSKIRFKILKTIIHKFASIISIICSHLNHNNQFNSNQYNPQSYIGGKYNSFYEARMMDQQNQQKIRLKHM